MPLGLDVRCCLDCGQNVIVAHESGADVGGDRTWATPHACASARAGEIMAPSQGAPLPTRWLGRAVCAVCKVEVLHEFHRGEEVWAVALPHRCVYASRSTSAESAGEASRP